MMLATLLGAATNFELPVLTAVKVVHSLNKQIDSYEPQGF